MALATLTVVVLRYLFNLGSIALQESVLYMHALVFMLGIPYTLQRDQHVRVDIVYSRLSTTGRAWVNLTGHVCLLVPVSLTILISSWPYVSRSWQVLEGSPEVGGIPGTFLLKSLIPVLALLLLAQGCAEIIRQLRALRGPEGSDPHRG